MKNDPLLPFFSPKGVVIVGVSRDPGKLGYMLARNLVQSGYQGAIHFVNPKPDTLFGKPIYSSIDQVPDPVDLAAMLVPPPAVPGALAEVGKRGIKAAIIQTGGFREVGAEGARLEEECLRVAREYGIRLVGPNCIGLIDTHLPINTSFLQPPGPPVGEIAFVSHSGAICAAVMDWIRGQGIGISNLISLGNEVDVSESDVLPVMAANKHARVITLYMEGVQDGRRFIDAARETVKVKPVLALKVGRFESGKKAAASHTGALAGSESAFDAAFEKAGVIRVNTTEELFQWAKALAWCPKPKGRRVAVITNSGGPGVTAADALELNGLELAKLSPATVAGMRTFLPAAASLNNPVDMLASATPDHFSGCLRLLMEDDGVDSILVISPPPPPSTTGAVVKSMIPIIQSNEKPVVFALMGEDQVAEGLSLLRASHIPDYRFPEWAASALGAVTRYAEISQKLNETPQVKLRKASAKAVKMLAGEPAGEFISPESAAKLLDAYQIPTTRLVLCKSADEAARQAARTGFPVVLKVASPDIVHKSDIGGVLLGLKTAEEVKQGYETVIERARKAKPDAVIEGVHIQRMLSPGQEVITGMVRDPMFGPLMMFGSGGVEVEGLKDVAFGLAPLTAEEAEKMINSTWAGKKLNGFRSILPADKAAVIDILVKLSQLAMDCDSIAEMEINPLRVLTPGQGAFAVDIRIRLG